MWNLIITSILHEENGRPDIIDRLCRGLEGLLMQWPDYTEPRVEVCKKLSIIAAETSKAYLKRYYNFQTTQPPCDCQAKIEESDVSIVKRTISIISQALPKEPSEELEFMEAMTVPLAVQLTQSKRLNWLQWRTGLRIWEYFVKEGRIMEISFSQTHFLPFVLTFLRRWVRIFRTGRDPDPLRLRNGEMETMRNILPTMYSAIVAVAESGYGEDGNCTKFSS